LKLQVEIGLNFIYTGASKIILIYTPEGIMKNSIKMFLGLLLCLIVAVSFVACGDDSSSDGSVDAGTADTTPPGDVSGLSATAGYYQVKLDWTDPVDDDFDHIEITWTPGGASVQTPAKGIGTYTAISLSAGALHSFVVKASDSNGNLSTGLTIQETPLEHTDCVAGQYVFTEGSGTSDRVCSPCAAGTYSSTANASSCTSWTTCTAGEYESAAGTSTSDRVCSPKNTDGTVCTADLECQSGGCECADASCITRRCGVETCLCTFTTTGGTCSDGYITANTDPDNTCPNNLTCDGAGSCYTSCSVDANCDLGYTCTAGSCL
jgi:hypothetical protein